MESGKCEGRSLVELDPLVDRIRSIRQQAEDVSALTGSIVDRIVGESPPNPETITEKVSRGDFLIGIAQDELDSIEIYLNFIANEVSRI